MKRMQYMLPKSGSPHPIYQIIADKANHHKKIEWRCKCCGKVWIETINDRINKNLEVFSPRLCDDCIRDNMP